MNGVVVDVRDECAGGDEGHAPDATLGDAREAVEVSGIAARNLFRWNSVMLRVEEQAAETAAVGGAPPSDPLFVELVHIQTGSCVARVGDRVRRGRPLCRSGSVGFSPAPHLHLAAYRGDGDDAATVRVRFAARRRGGTPGGGAAAAPSSFLPALGGWYDGGGRVSGERRAGGDGRTPVAREEDVPK